MSRCSHLPLPTLLPPPNHRLDHDLGWHRRSLSKQLIVLSADSASPLAVRAPPAPPCNGLALLAQALCRGEIRNSVTRCAEGKLLN